MFRNHIPHIKRNFNKYPIFKCLYEPSFINYKINGGHSMDTDIKKKVGLRLKELRLAKGLKQEDLEKFGFSYRYYGKIERGLANVTLVRICEIFEVTLSDLFAFMDSEQGVSEDREAVTVIKG